MLFVRRPLAVAVAPVVLLVGSTVSAADDKATMPRVTISGALVDEIGSTAIDAAGLASRRAATRDTARLLDMFPGVDFYGAGGVSSLPVIRGLADDRLRIQVDGMSLISACGNHMNPPLSYIDPSNVGAIRVFSGIVPVSAGGDSIGGSIRVESPDPQFAVAGEPSLRRGEAAAFYRSNGDARGASVSATVAGEKLSLAYSGATAKAGNYEAGDDFKPAGLAAAGRGWLDGDVVGSSMYRSTNQALRLGLRHENHLAELKLGLQDIPYQGWPNQRMDMTGNDSTQVNLRYRAGFGWGAIDARAYRERTRHSMQFFDDKLYWYGPGNVPNSDGVAGPIGGGASGRAAGMPMDTEGTNIGATARADVVVSARDLLRVGGEMQRYRLDDWWNPSGRGMWPNVFWNINDGRRDRLAAFAEWEARSNTQWLTQLGLRVEQVRMDVGPVQGYSSAYSPADQNAFNAASRSRTDNNVDLTALARFTPSPTRTIELGYARKTRSPNLYERYAWSTHGMSMRMVNWAGDGNGYVGNLALKPETAHTVSATAAWQDAARERWAIRISPYLTYVRDYIAAERCLSTVVYGNACSAANLARTEGFVYLRFVNQSARLFGVDLSGHWLLGRSDRIGSFTATGAASVTRGRNRSTDDGLYNIMPLNATLALVHGLGGWTGTVEAQAVDGKDRVSRVRNEVRTAGYGLLHLRGSVVWSALRLDFGIENLLDRFYSHPLGGAYLGQGKTMSGTDVPWGVPVPGAGRALYVGVSAAF
jgi:iron complex outermembrane receptor protein